MYENLKLSWTKTDSKVQQIDCSWCMVMYIKSGTSIHEIFLNNLTHRILRFLQVSVIQNVCLGIKNMGR